MLNQVVHLSNATHLLCVVEESVHADEFRAAETRDAGETAAAAIREARIVPMIVWCERRRLDRHTDQYAASWEGASVHCRPVRVVAEVVEPVEQRVDMSSKFVVCDWFRIRVLVEDMAEHKIQALAVLGSDEVEGIVEVVLNPFHSCREDWQIQSARAKKTRSSDPVAQPF